MTVDDRYFNWLVNIISSEELMETNSKLLSTLHHVEFKCEDMDMNMREHGIELRKEFAMWLDLSNRAYSYLMTRPCSVLEMLVALSKKMEDIMHNTTYGDRTWLWFWGMISNLQLKNCIDYRYNEREVLDKLIIFMSRNYEKDGFGGLFCVENAEYDMTKLSIWQQMNYFLKEIACYE